MKIKAIIHEGLLMIDNSGLLEFYQDELENVLKRKCIVNEVKIYQEIVKLHKNFEKKYLTKEEK